MMQLWSPDHIRFMEDAAAYGIFHRQLLQHILPFLPQDGHICDVGCGLGHLAQEMASHCRKVTACDVAEAPLAKLKKAKPDNLSVLHADIYHHTPELPYDGMVFCFFGDPEMILSVAQKQCCGPVVVVQRAAHHHRFAAADVPPHRKFGRELTELLDEQGIAYRSLPLSLEFGQPFRSKEDALVFFSLYGQGKPLCEEEIFSRLLPINDHPAFTFYLPQPRELTITVFEVPRKKHLFLTGEKGVGKSTMLKRLLQGKGDIGGFLTVRRPVGKGNFAVYMTKSRHDEPGEENFLFTCGSAVDPFRFDDLGCRILAESVGKSIILMDELGPKERDAAAFQLSVLQQLEGDTPVYGVIQDAESTFLQQVRRHPAVQLVRVTKENRDELLRELKKKW